jgi:hypothetical protein
MASDLDIYRSANELIEHHGDTATLFAAERADALLAAGNMEGRRVWLSILDAVKVLLQREVPGGERVH